MKFRELFNAPPAEGYIKNSSILVTALFVIGGILYYPTDGYGTVIALVAALIVLFGQKLLISQMNKDLADMYFAKKQYEATGNLDYLKFILARSNQILTDNKMLSDKGKREVQMLQEYAKKALEITE
ncbi:hypothetical protein [Necropsobacter rosorum]|uniref:hypothetical protein n=1 Tax=Necropsobacter rosorum TaxID=908285 RepID=UPI000509C543